GRERDAAIAGKVETMQRRSGRVCFVSADLKVNQIVFATIVLGHLCERFPIDPFFIDAQAAPAGLVLENLVGKLIDAGTSLARAGVTGDEPTATKLVSSPGQPAEPCHIWFFA